MNLPNGRHSLHPGDSDRPAAARPLGRLRAALKMAEVRLRLPAVLVCAALVVGRWDVLRDRFNRLTRQSTPESIAGHAISADTEYFCPMDPGVLSEWPGRCGVCNMALVRRKKGEATLLPDGVVARMQISPYRIQLAGIRTEPASFRPLSRDWSSSGFVVLKDREARVEVEVPPRQAPWIEKGSAVLAACSDCPGVTFAGHVASIIDHTGWRTASVLLDGPPRDLRNGMIATVHSAVPVASLEPFRSQPRHPPELAPGEPRRLFVCAEHADSIALVAGRCPLDGREREPRRLGEQERVRYWCPMHPAVTADHPGASCRACGGMTLSPRVVVYAPAGEVLAVPQSAVVDTGLRQVVFVEEMPGMFDGVEVTLGARCGDHYPVVKGIEPGQRVVVSGAFLLDAETRLNPALASAYFGAGGSGRAPAAAGPGTQPPAKGAALDGLGPEDRPIAERQRTCPVTGKPLGSMGTPDRQVVSGRVVFLCCAGCRARLLGDPARYLAKVPAP